MKIRFAFSFLLSLLVAAALQARPRTIDEVKEIAVSHYNSLQQLRSTQEADLELVYTGPSSGLRSASNPYYYVFNISKAKGFVMVSGDDRILPVLGYSTNGPFDPANIPANLLGWLEGYERQIDHVLSQPAPPLPAPSPRLRPRDAFPDHVGPLVKSEWGQEAPYNGLCPMDGNARSLAGCVATAISQIMYYHKWPEKGQGQATYHASTINRDISVNFADYTFDWANMAAKYGPASAAAQNKAVAELIYAAGTASQMDYGSAFSGTYPVWAAHALKTYFGYDGNLYDKKRDYCSSAEWTTLIKTELASGRPVMYTGQSYGGGHSFICDGYDKEGLFHLNWGWGGLFDGYFQLDICNPYYGYDVGIGGFSYRQDMVVGIQKPASGSTKPEGALLQYGFGLSANKYAQEDSLVAVACFIYEGSAPAGIEISLALYQGNRLYKLLGKKQEEGDPSSINHITVADTVAPFKLPAGEYGMRYVYREAGQEQWKDVIHNNMSNAYTGYLLEASRDSIEVWSGYTRLACTGLAADKELHQNATNTFYMKLKNLQMVEVCPQVSILYRPANKEGKPEKLSTEGIYLSAGEEKALMIPVWLGMEPGTYDFWVCYAEKDNYLYFINDKPLTLEVLPGEEETANGPLNASPGLEVSVSDKVLSVRSDSPVEYLCVFNLEGKPLHRISPAATGVSLSLGWASNGVYVVALKNASGWHRYKMIF